MTSPPPRSPATGRGLLREYVERSHALATPPNPVIVATLKQRALDATEASDAGAGSPAAVLELSHASVTPRDACALLASLRGPRGRDLQYLDMSRSTFSPRALRLLSDFVRSSGLRHLILANCNLEDQQCGDLLRAAGPRALRLETLDFAGCRCGRRTCEELAVLLSDPSCRLRRVCVDRTRCGDEGVEILAAALSARPDPMDPSLPWVPGLRCLSARGCGAGSRGGSAMAASLRSNGMVLFAFLEYNKIPSKAARAIAQYTTRNREAYRGDPNEYMYPSEPARLLEAPIDPPHEGGGSVGDEDEGVELEVEEDGFVGQERSASPPHPLPPADAMLRAVRRGTSSSSSSESGRRGGGGREGEDGGVGSMRDVLRLSPAMVKRFADSTTERRTKAWSSSVRVDGKGDDDRDAGEGPLRGSDRRVHARGAHGVVWSRHTSSSPSSSSSSQQQPQPHPFSSSRSPSHSPSSTPRSRSPTPVPHGASSGTPLVFAESGRTVRGRDGRRVPVADGPVQRGQTPKSPGAAAWRRFLAAESGSARRIPPSPTPRSHRPHASTYSPSATTHSTSGRSPAAVMSSHGEREAVWDEEDDRVWAASPPLHTSQLYASTVRSLRSSRGPLPHHQSPRKPMHSTPSHHVSSSHIPATPHTAYTQTSAGISIHSDVSYGGRDDDDDEEGDDVLRLARQLATEAEQAAILAEQRRAQLATLLGRPTSTVKRHHHSHNPHLPSSSSPSPPPPPSSSSSPSHSSPPLASPPTRRPHPSAPPAHSTSPGSQHPWPSIVSRSHTGYHSMPPPISSSPQYAPSAERQPPLAGGGGRGRGGATRSATAAASPYSTFVPRRRELREPHKGFETVPMTAAASMLLHRREGSKGDGVKVVGGMGLVSSPAAPPLAPAPPSPLPTSHAPPPPQPSPPRPTHLAVQSSEESALAASSTVSAVARKLSEVRAAAVAAASSSPHHQQQSPQVGVSSKEKVWERRRKPIPRPPPTPPTSSSSLSPQQASSASTTSPTLPSPAPSASVEAPGATRSAQTRKEAKAEEKKSVDLSLPKPHPLIAPRSSKETDGSIVTTEYDVTPVPSPAAEETKGTMKHASPRPDVSPEKVKDEASRDDEDGDGVANGE